MFTAKESRTFQQLSAWKPPDSHHMAHLPLEHKHPFLANDVSPGLYNPNVHGLNTSQENSYLKDVRFTSSNMFGLLDKPTHTSDTRKRYLIFDQSGNGTRLFVSPQVPSKTPATADGLREKVITVMDNRFLLKPDIQEKWEGSGLADEGGEMREDTEDIDALLYSSSDECSNNSESDDDDEVTSTVQTPLKIGGNLDNGKLLAQFLGEEVASSDDSPKRQKLSDEKYYKTSAQCVYEDVLESNCAAGINLTKRENKVKIRNALKIIASMVPGLKSDNPISILDEAIIFLKSMRAEAEALGPSQPESDSASFS